MSSEPVVIRGKLKLKGSSSSSSSISGKKRKSSETSSADQINKTTSVSNISNIPAKTINNDSQEYAGSLTEAQRKFMKRKQEVDSKSVKALTATTYRDRVESFNQKLSNMTEHNDIPRISAAGNG